MHSGGDVYGDDAAGTGNRCIASVVDEGSVASQRYFMARRTVLEMLRDRGYAVPDFELCGSVSDFRSVYGQHPEVERLRICVSHRSDTSRKILVIFAGAEEIRKKTIDGILNQIVNKGSLHGVILILQSKMTFHAKKVVDEFSVKVETFQITDLLVNITKHIIAPKYEILTSEEKEKLLKNYQVEGKQLPRMLENDAISRYYGLQKGDMVKVSYNGAVTESLVTYRCVS
ncbi:DNA-directed RNA polymerase [Bertholletia excelsa]